MELADPERALAVAYAPADRRPALTALFALDERLASIVAATTEPTIGLIRLAWWRESLEKLDLGPPPAEPLLHALASLLPLGLTGVALSEIEDGWAALLEGDLDEAALARHARRGGNLFALAAHILGDPATPVTAAGEGWALADLGHRHSSPDVQKRARQKAAGILAVAPLTAWPKKLRPLGMLAVLARKDTAHNEVRRQGAPGRLLRMLALRLTGR